METESPVYAALSNMLIMTTTTAVLIIAYALRSFSKQADMVTWFRSHWLRFVLGEVMIIGASIVIVTLPQFGGFVKELGSHPAISLGALATFIILAVTTEPTI